MLNGSEAWRTAFLNASFKSVNIYFFAGFRHRIMQTCLYADVFTMSAVSAQIESLFNFP